MAFFDPEMMVSISGQEVHFFSSSKRRTGLPFQNGTSRNTDGSSRQARRSVSPLLAWSRRIAPRALTLKNDDVLQCLDCTGERTIGIQAAVVGKSRCRAFPCGRLFEKRSLLRKDGRGWTICFGGSSVAYEPTPWGRSSLPRPPSAASAARARTAAGMAPDRICWMFTSCTPAMIG